MAQYIDKDALVAEIERRKQVAFGWMETAPNDAIEAEFELCDDILSFLDTLEVKEVQEEPVSNDLEEAASQYPSVIRTISPQWESELENAFKAGAKWQYNQFEKNRIEHCDNITEEQYNLETGFIDQYIDKHHCMPTFLSAIEYGMEKQKGQMIKKACEWLEEHLLDFWSQKITNTDYFIEEFKKAMKE